MAAIRSRDPLRLVVREWAALFPLPLTLPISLTPPSRPTGTPLAHQGSRSTTESRVVGFEEQLTCSTCLPEAPLPLAPMMQLTWAPVEGAMRAPHLQLAPLDGLRLTVWLGVPPHDQLLLPCRNISSSSSSSSSSTGGIIRSSSKTCHSKAPMSANQASGFTTTACPAASASTPSGAKAEGAQAMLQAEVVRRPRDTGVKGSQGPSSDVGVGIIRLWRPEALNALCQEMMRQFAAKMGEMQADPQVGAVVVTGHGKAFAAGADIAEMRGSSFASALGEQMLSGWETALRGPHARKPVIAAVNGYALGGGCELAMMCDIILAGEQAVFGQPEVRLGVIPGMGGTQRLVRAVGKSRAMEMILGGGSFLSASEAVQLGLASRVVPGDADALVEEALTLGVRIASMSPPVVALAKECVNSAYESMLGAGLDRERTAFYATFGLDDQEEGMSAFLEKRVPVFKGS